MEITYNDWVMDAGAGREDTLRYEEIHRAANEGMLTIVDDKGKRWVPVKVEELWTLEPKIEQ